MNLRELFPDHDDLLLDAATAESAADEKEKKAVPPPTISSVDGPPVAESDVLSDEKLFQGGLVPVRAFMRSNGSANALRQARKREEKAKDGLRQLNIVVPDDEASRSAVKAVAAAMCERRVSASQVLSFGVMGAPEPPAPVELSQDEQEALDLGRRAMRLRGVRGLLVRRWLGLDG